MAAMAVLEAYLVITLLIWVAVIVSGTTPELSTTTGDTVNVPCLFGGGTLLYILWYYNDSTGTRNILKLDEEVLTIAAGYADRASLHDDNSTLILKEISVADEGTYHCVVHRLGQTAVPNFKTKLNVFSLRPDTLPVISPCTWVDDSSSCSIRANQPFILTCTLPNVYPVKDTELIWYQDGKHFSSIHDVTQNDDGTTDFSRQIKIYETGNFTCNATYISVNGRENTAISVEARIILPTDVSNTPVKSMTSGKIAWIIIGIVLLVGISLAINNLFLYLWKARGQLSSTNDEQSQAESAELTERPTAYTCVNECGFVATSTEETKRPGTSAVNGSTDRNVFVVPSTEERKRLGTSAGNSSTDNIEEPTLLGTSEENDFQDDNDDSSAPLPSSTVRRRNVMSLNHNNIEISRRTDLNARQGGTYMGTLDLLRTWRDKQTASTENAALREALFKAGFDNLAAQYLSTPVTGDDSTSLPSSTVTHGESLNRKDRIVKDKELRKLAGCLPEDSYTDVAIHLGLTNTDYDNIKLQNQSSFKDANFKMLMKWKTDKGGQVGVLDEALTEAQCGGLSYKGGDSTSLPSSSVTHGESLNRMDRMVTDGELDKLAGCLPADFYTRVAINLGVGYAERSNIKKQNAATLKDATFEMLMNWRREKDGGKMRDLDAALNEADCGGISYKDGSSANGKFGALGGKLSTESHGYTLHIPPGALEEDVQISLNVLTDIPKGLTLKEDELLVSHGFQCHPSGLRFKKPAKLTIPHCAIVTTPNKIQTVLYSWNQALPGTPKRLPDSSGITCSVQERWLEVSVSHFSGGFLALIYDWIFLKGILLSCMSFLPRALNPSKETVLEVCFAKKPHGQKWTDVHELNHPKVQPVKRDDDEFVLRQRTLTVACQLGKKSPKSGVHNIRHSDLSMQTKVTEYFELDFAKESEETLVTLEVVQTSTRTIKFFTCFQGQQQETATGSSSAATSAPTSTSRREITDGDIYNLSRILPDGKYGRLGDVLGFPYNYVEQILKKRLNDFRAAFEEVLHEWKNKGGSIQDLDAALREADLGEFVPKYKK